MGKIAQCPFQHVLGGHHRQVGDVCGGIDNNSLTLLKMTYYLSSGFELQRADLFACRFKGILKALLAPDNRVYNRACLQKSEGSD